MSEKILSQDEISALLGHVNDEVVSPETPDTSEQPTASPTTEVTLEATVSKAKEEPQPSTVVDRNLFPILRPQGLGTELENALNVVLDSFVQNGVSSLAAALRAQVDMEVDGLDQLSYREFIHTLPEPSSIWSLKLRPLGLSIALCLEPKLVHAMVDLLMGGEGRSLGRDRTITELDQSVVESMVRFLSKEFQEAWRRLISFESNIEGRETRPGFLQLYSPAESMISIVVRMHAGGTDGHIFWGIPSQMLLRFEHSVQTPTKGSGQLPEEAAAEIHRIIQDIPTQLNAHIAGTRIRVQELLALSEGDVVKLDHRVQAPIDLAVNGVSKFLGHVVLSHGQKAVQIAEGSEDQ